MKNRTPKGTPNQHTKVPVGRVCHWRPLLGGPIACEGPFFADDRASADEPRVTCGNCKITIEDAAEEAAKNSTGLRS